ncbi:MAG: DUF1028 domain-containing protein [Chloroflexi bacterium]|nr:DUF1028 domain-containing protein [Chloroflexota bacterium]
MTHPHLTTFSIVACDLDEPAWGAAVASKFLAAGALVTWARAGAGVIATQAFARVSFGPRGLDLMAGGLDAQATLDRLLADDPEREHRQVGCVDAQGQAAAFTGGDCFDWAGHRTGAGYTCQGNILTGPEPLNAIAHAFETTSSDLAGRLMAALLAGDTAGGDRRGKQSAALVVVKPDGGYGGDHDRWLDLRVDDDPDPVNRLAGLLELHRLYFGKTAQENLLPIKPALASELQGVLARRGYYDGPVTGTWDEASIQAFWAFVGTENLEERWTPQDAHRLDPVILTFIRERFGDA